MLTHNEKQLIREAESPVGEQPSAADVQQRVMRWRNIVRPAQENYPVYYLIPQRGGIARYHLPEQPGTFYPIR